MKDDRELSADVTIKRKKGGFQVVKPQTFRTQNGYKTSALSVLMEWV